MGKSTKYLPEYGHTAGGGTIFSFRLYDELSDGPKIT